MILSFKQKFDDGSATNFPLAIWKGLLIYQLATQTQFETYRLLAKKQNHQILEGELPEHPKIHSLREDVHNRWGHGSMINYYIAARTRTRFEFGPYIPCTGTQEIEINYFNDQNPVFTGQVSKIAKDHYNEVEVVVSDRVMTIKEIDKLALNDGFKSTQDFFNYFNKDFKGKIVHWTDFKY